MKTKKIANKIKLFITRQNIILSYLLIFLLADYIFLFALESILPGFVTLFFNINALLIIIIFLWLALALAEKKTATKAFPLWLKIIFLLTGILISIALFFVFLGISFGEMAVYFVLIALLFLFIYNYILNEEKVN